MSVTGAEVDDIDTRPNCSSPSHVRPSEVHERNGHLPALRGHGDPGRSRQPEQRSAAGGGEGRINVQAWTGQMPTRASPSRTAPSTAAAPRACRYWATLTACRSSTTSSHNLSQSGCDPIHIGGIQIYGGVAHPPEGQLLPRQRRLGRWAVDDRRRHHGLLENNVWVCTCDYPWSIQAAATRNSTFVHNMFAGGGGIHFYTRQGMASETSSATTCSRIRQRHHLGSQQHRLGTHDHNLNAGVPGKGNLKGRPVFVGGKKPKSYQGYRLARGSRGKGAASDGGDLGIRARR